MFTVDMHNDSLEEVTKPLRKRNEKFWNPEVKPLSSYYEKYRSGNAAVHVTPIAGDSMVHDSDPLKIMGKISYLKHQISDEAKNFVIATTAQQIRDAHEQNKISLVLSFEGCRALLGETYLLETFYELGLRVAGLTWNHRNELGYGIGEEEDAGLSRVGKRLVKEMNRLGIIVDVSHASYKTTMDALEISTRPVIASHSNAMAIHNSNRNLTDDQIELIAEQHGIIGIVFYPYLVSSKDPTLDDVVNHVEHIASLVGVDCIGFGSDFIDFFSHDWIKTVLALEGLEIRGKIQYPPGLESAKDYPNLADHLSKRGFKSEEVEKMMGLNFLRVFENGCG